MKCKKIKFAHFILMILIVSLMPLLVNCPEDKPPIVPKEDIILGIYSETAPDILVPDIDSYIGTYTDDKGGSISEFIDDTNEKKEGGISKKATMSVDASQNQYAGWFVQNDIIGTSDSKTKNMSDFKGGKLTFWVKSPINLGIGIRSGNVQPGSETSKVMLNNYPPFQTDNEWHRICIPLSDFTGEKPKADLSQIKIFFNVFANTPSGGTGGEPKTFWIDDVRWEIRYNTEYDCP